MSTIFYIIKLELKYSVYHILHHTGISKDLHVLDNFLVDGTVLLNTGVAKTVVSMTSNALLLDRESVKEKENKEDNKGVRRAEETQTGNIKDQGNFIILDQF